MRPPSCRESPAAKPQMSIISCTSPSPSERIFPVSSVTSRPSCGTAARSSSPNSRINSPRCGAGTFRHSRYARCALRIASSVADAVVLGTSAMASPVMGVCTVRLPDE